jgi:hypothetical protein
MKYTTFLLCLLTILLSGCFPTTTLTPFPTATRTSTQVPTATVVWFPATETPTPMPTQFPSPTVELRPGVGGVLFSEDFDSSANWTLLETASDRVIVGGNEITLALGRPEGYINSILEGALFSNFYTEITVHTNLCSRVDEYGMLIRYQSPVNHYRYSLSCDGRVRLDRIYSGIASSPQDWMISAAVPSAAPSTSRLGVWAVGQELRFFINDQYQFAINDSAIPSGTMGVFVRSGGDTAVTVSFSDLQIYKIEQ